MKVMTFDRLRRRFAIFFFSILVFLTFFSMIEYQIINNNAWFHKNILLQMQENEWRVVWGKINTLKTEATATTDLIANKIRTEIKSYYGSDIAKMSKDMSNYNTDKNPIIQIIANNIVGYHLNNVKSDADDMWAASRTAIISDFSVECAAEGRTREFDKEISLHYNKVLATQALDKILRMDNGLIGWQFSKPPNPEYTMNNFNEAGLKELYLKHRLGSLESFEVLVVSYIDPNIDLLGKYLINYSDIKQSNNQIIITQGFNIVRQFNNDQLIMVQLSTFDQQKKALEATYLTENTLMIMLLLFTLAMSIMIVIVGNVLLYWEQKILDEQKNNKIEES